MLNLAQAKTVILQKDVRRRLVDEFLVIGDVGPRPVGRPRARASLLGAERRQIDLIVGVQVMRLFEEECAREGVVIDPEMDLYLTDKGRRIFVGGILNAASRFDLHEVSGAPVETLFKSSGKFIRIRRTEPSARGGPGRYSYITKHVASQMEVLAAFNTQREEEETRAGVVTGRLEAYAKALNAWPAGAATFEEAFAMEASARLRRQ